MDLSIVIPAHNESKNLPILIGEIYKVLSSKNVDFEIIVVNDNSTDSTNEILGELRKRYANLRFLNRNGPRGVGYTLREGFELVRGQFVITMDADGSHDPRELPTLLKKLREGYDIVIGSRYIPGGRIDSSLGRKILSRGFSFFCNLLGLHVHDSTSGYRGHRSEALKELNLESIGFEIHVEIPMKAQKKGYRITEVPIRYAKRRSGKGNLKYVREAPRYIKTALKFLL